MTTLTTPSMTGSHTHTTLSKGSTGDEVKYVQGVLQRFYASSLITNGIFQTDTEVHVKRFQTDCNIPIDGVVGQQTWTYLDNIPPYSTSPHTILRRNSISGEVKYLQVRLNSYFGPELKVDGRFGAQTEAQVKRFQAICKIVVDGIVGPTTWTFVDQPNLDI